MELSEARRRWLALVAVALGGLLFGCCGGVGSLSVWDRLAPASAPGGAAARHGRVTGAHFDALKSDKLRYGDVVRIIGFEGREYTRKADGAHGFIWSNPDGSNLTCEFEGQAGLLYDAAQAGLK